ncbi:unnamed protein product [Menidia menidia]|uniref:(Atlantic silverside) hypothetical protein n=1 Tax=Menidia menidia TaxID=238744 RepID=A0A8S4B9V5_9TELE|nr:unnamed protein product [Menidia menidia]
MMTVTVVAAVAKALACEASVSVARGMSREMTVWAVAVGWHRTGQRAGRVRPALVGSRRRFDAGRRSVSLDWVRPRCGVDLWEEGFPPLLGGGRNEQVTTGALQQPERDPLLQNSRPGLGQLHQREPPSPEHPPDQDPDDVAEHHAARDEGGADQEEHPREGKGGEADAAQKSSGRLRVQGRQSHTGQRNRKQAFRGCLHVHFLQEVQEAVKEARGGGQQGEKEDEPHRAEAFLHAATQKQHSRDVEQELSKGSVVERIHKDPVDVPTLKNTLTDAEDALSQVQISLDAKQNT